MLNHNPDRRVRRGGTADCIIETHGAAAAGEGGERVGNLQKYVAYQYLHCLLGTTLKSQFWTSN